MRIPCEGVYNLHCICESRDGYGRRACRNTIILSLPTPPLKCTSFPFRTGDAAEILGRTGKGFSGRARIGDGLERKLRSEASSAASSSSSSAPTAGYRAAPASSSSSNYSGGGVGRAGGRSSTGGSVAAIPSYSGSHKAGTSASSLAAREAVDAAYFSSYLGKGVGVGERLES